MPRSSSLDIEQAVAAAKAAFPSWSKLSQSERATYLEKIASKIEEKHEYLAQLESRGVCMCVCVFCFDLCFLIDMVVCCIFDVCFTMCVF